MRRRGAAIAAGGAEATSSCARPLPGPTWVRRAAVLLLLAGCATPSTPAPAPPTAAAAAPAIDPRCGMDLRRLFADELALRPDAAPQDLYLLVREAVLGPQPPPDEAEVARLLASLQPAANEPIIEDLDEVQGTVRLHLRKWLFIGGNAAELHEVLAGAIGHLPDGRRLEACLEAAPAALEALGGDAEGLAAYLEAKREEAWPAVEHSEKYKKTYQPAYRVVFRRHLPPWVTAPPPTTG